VKDFHGDQAAQQAAESWARQFQKDEVPDDIKVVKIAGSDVYAKDGEVVPNPPYYPLYEPDEIATSSWIPLFRLDKIITSASLSSSNSEAVRKLKERAVRIDGNVVGVNLIATFPPRHFTLSVGRKLTKIELVK
jgi:tyrosyl-tRNA synthetase